MSKKKPVKPSPVEQRRETAEPVLAPPPPPAAVIVRSHEGWLLTVAEGLSIAALFVFMLTKSWLRWMDPLIDFPRDLYLAWRVSEGDLLYKDVANWYGPLPQLTEGAGFHLFGVGIDTIVWMNIVLTAGVICLVWGIFGALGNRLSRWLCVVVFIVVFGFGHYSLIANYNFIAPYSAQSTYGLAGLLLLLWSLLRQLKSPRPHWLMLAGLGLAIAYLDKPEPLLASLGVLGVYGLAEFLIQARRNSPNSNWRGALAWAGRSLGWLTVGFSSLWLPVFIYFLFRGGFDYALLATNFVPHSVLDTRFQATIEHSHLMQVFFGFDQPWMHFISHLKAGAVLLLVLGIMLVASRTLARAHTHTPIWWLSALVILLTAGVGVWLGNRANYWMDVGAAFVLPVILAAVVTAGWSWWAAWQNRAEAVRLLGLAMVGTAAALMLVRMILHGRIYQFGFFMMPLAVLFVIHLMLGEMARPQPGRPPAQWLLPVAFAVLVMVGVCSLGGISLRVYAKKTASVGEGRDQFYAYPPRATPNSAVLNPSSGTLLNLMIHVFRIKTPNAKTLVVFPEGIAANYHLRVRSPLMELEFHPVALGYVGPQEVVDELKDHAPDAIFLHVRDYAEFGERYFGDNDASGRPIMAWIAANYLRVAKGGRTRATVTGNVIDLLTPKPRPGAQPLYILEPIN